MATTTSAAARMISSSGPMRPRGVQNAYPISRCRPKHTIINARMESVKPDGRRSRRRYARRPIRRHKARQVSHASPSPISENTSAWWLNCAHGPCPQLDIYSCNELGRAPVRMIRAVGANRARDRTTNLVRHDIDSLLVANRTPEYRCVLGPGSNCGCRRTSDRKSEEHTSELQSPMYLV